MNIELIKKYFSLTPTQKNLLIKFAELLLEWNNKINLISRQDTGFIWERHILHSLAIAKILDLKTAHVIDVGSGGGFPGIPLAIMFPNADFTLIDTIAKKVTALQGIIDELGLDNAKALRTHSKNVTGKFDFVTARAVADFRKFYKQTKHLVRKGQITSLPNGILYLKGGDFQQEIAPFGKRARIFDIQEFFEEPFFETKKVIYLSF